MASPQLAKQHQTASEHKTKAARLFFLDASSGRVLSVNRDGSDKKAIASGGRVLDGIAVDTDAAHIYWRDMVGKDHYELQARKSKMTL
jgi:hypothetical protein